MIDCDEHLAGDGDDRSLVPASLENASRSLLIADRGGRHGDAWGIVSFETQSRVLA